MKFKEGDTVKVVKQELLTSNLIGHVVSSWINEYGSLLIAVRFEQEDNPNFHRKKFPFSLNYYESSLKIVSNYNKEIKMKNSTKPLEGYDYVVTAEPVEQNCNTSFAIFAMYSDTESISSGDFFVGLFYDKLKIFKVRDVFTAERFNADNTDTKIKFEIVSKIDTSKLNERLRIREEKQKLLDNMRRRADSLKEMQYFEILSEKDSEMKELLEQYKELK